MLFCWTKLSTEVLKTYKLTHEQMHCRGHKAVSTVNLCIWHFTAIQAALVSSVLTESYPYFSLAHPISNFLISTLATHKLHSSSIHKGKSRKGLRNNRPVHREWNSTVISYLKPLLFVGRWRFIQFIGKGPWWNLNYKRNLLCHYYLISTQT